MAIRLEKETEKHLLDSIKRFFDETLDTEIGDLKATLVLEFCLKEVGPSVYNRAIEDAQAFFQEKAADLSGSRHETEFAYWKK